MGTKSNLAGIAHVVSRMDWYCALSKHLRDTSMRTRAESFQVDLQQLEKKIIVLYRALFLYQMNSAYSYYQSSVDLHHHAIRRDWVSDLKIVTDAEDDLLNDWEMYDKPKAKSLRSELLQRAKEFPPNSLSQYRHIMVKGGPSDVLRQYNHMMNKINDGKVEHPHYCKNVLAAATLALSPLTPPELAVLADLPPNISPLEIVQSCDPFLRIDGGTVSPTNQWAKDFLTTWLQPGGVAQGHADISRRSITTMSSVLKQNMCNLSSGSKPSDVTPPELDKLAPIQYSCVFWAHHLSLSGESPEFKRDLTDNGAEFEFLKKHFLHWLESLSLLGKLSDGALSIKKLLHVVQVRIWCYCYGRN